MINQLIQLINTTIHIIAKPKSSTYIDFIKENDKEDPNYKVGDHVRISKYDFIKENNKEDSNQKVGDHVRISKYKTLHSKLV